MCYILINAFLKNEKKLLIIRQCLLLLSILDFQVFIHEEENSSAPQKYSADLHGPSGLIPNWIEVLALYNLIDCMLLQEQVGPDFDEGLFFFKSRLAEGSILFI